MITLSILIPSIPSRFDRMTKLYDKLMKQVQDKPVEILCLIDNKKRSIGLKRDALVQSCKGAYLAFVDDDDDISSDYIDEMLKGCNTGKDIVCFRQGATISHLGNKSCQYFNDSPLCTPISNNLLGFVLDNIPSYTLKNNSNL